LSNRVIEKRRRKRVLNRPMAQSLNRSISTKS
jgi:hypothetical protein